MKQVEKIIILLSTLAIIGRYIDFVGSNILSVFFLSSLSFFYLLGGWYFLKDFKSKYQNIYVSIISGFVLSFAILSLLFKVQYWNNGNYNLTYSLIINFIYLTILIPSIIKNMNRYKMLLLYRMAYIIFLQIIVFVIF